MVFPVFGLTITIYQTTGWIVEEWAIKPGMHVTPWRSALFSERNNLSETYYYVSDGDDWTTANAVHAPKSYLLSQIYYVSLHFLTRSFFFRVLQAVFCVRHTKVSFSESLAPSLSVLRQPLRERNGRRAKNNMLFLSREKLRPCFQSARKRRGRKRISWRGEGLFSSK